MEMRSPIDIVLEAYRDGVFPMAESADDPHFAFYKPHLRALLPIHDLHIPKSLKKTIKKRPYSVTINKAFSDIIDGCAMSARGRENTWINQTIRDLFILMNAHGHAHSIECWDANGQLAGGLYGMAIGCVFCGESMVSFQKDASKIALVHLCALLEEGGYLILDSQFINPHIARFGAYEIPQSTYEQQIKTAMNKNPADAIGTLQPSWEKVEAYLHRRKGQ